MVGLAGALREGHLMTIVDVGDAQGDAAHRALARADRIVLVTTPAADAVAAAGTALSRVRQVDPARLAAMAMTGATDDHRVAGSGFAATPNAERHVLVADSLRRRQLCAAMLHGTRRNWRDRRRSWPGFLAGAVVTALALAGVAVYRAFQAVSG